MSAFRATHAAATAGPRRQPPLRTVPLEPSAWAETYAERPKTRVSIGLRLISEADEQAARGDAGQHAWRYVPGEMNDEVHEERVQAFNDALMRVAVARGTCRSDDVTTPFFVLAEDQIADALRGETITMLWDELIRLRAEHSPLSPEITTDESLRLSSLIAGGALGDATTRRMLKWCLSKIDAPHR